MNAKLCKKLRKNAIFISNENEINTTYRDKIVKRVQVSTGELSSKGKPIFKEEQRIIRLLASCVRYYYQQLKRNIKCKTL